jgi:hypothetical protein
MRANRTRLLPHGAGSSRDGRPLSRSSATPTSGAAEGILAGLGSARDGAAGSIQALLLGAEFGNHPVRAQQASSLIAAGNAIPHTASVLAARS